MDRKKLDALRAKYGNHAPATSHHPEFKTGHRHNLCGYRSAAEAL